MTYELLIIYADGTEHIVTGVSKYGIYENNCNVAYYNKNGNNSIIPLDKIRFIWKNFDYLN